FGHGPSGRSATTRARLLGHQTRSEPAIWPNGSDANSAKTTMSKKFVTFQSGLPRSVEANNCEAISRHKRAPQPTVGLVPEFLPNGRARLRASRLCLPCLPAGLHLTN